MRKLVGDSWTIVTPLSIATAVPLSVRDRALPSNVAGSIGFENVMSMVSLGVLRGLATGLRLVRTAAPVDETGKFVTIALSPATCAGSEIFVPSMVRL